MNETVQQYIQRMTSYTEGKPPLAVQIIPVPAQAMHSRKPRRSRPSVLWSCKMIFSLVLFIVIDCLVTCLK